MLGGRSPTAKPASTLHWRSAGTRRPTNAERIVDRAHVVTPFGEEHRDDEGVHVRDHAHAERRREPAGATSRPEHERGRHEQERPEGTTAPRVIARVAAELP